MTIKVGDVKERRIEWIPKGYDSSKVALIRNGVIEHFPPIDDELAQADIDGCLEFIQAIKQAMADTKEP